jgi:uncharacterized phage protein (TIGR01671 family)
MREIKFRAWDETKKAMHNDFQFIKSGEEGNDWIVFTSDKQTLQTKPHPLENPFFQQQLKIMQYTGLKDKNGKKIYEGDIISVVDIGDIPSENSRHQVVYCGEDDYPAFDLKPHIDCDSNGLSYLKAGGDEEMIILGNIYENPELLKEK